MKRFIFSLVGLLITIVGYATHNRAGEITYKQIDALTYEFTLVTYTDVSSSNHADRREATLNFGDNTASTSPRSNGPTDPQGFPQGEVLPFAPNYKKNIYKFIHTFPGQGSYRIGYGDPNRNGGVLNMANSIETAFYVETFLVINPFIGFNTSPTLTLEPIDFGGLGKLFVHNPGAYDIDGDSLSYKLIPCKQDVNKEVSLFKFITKENGFTDTSFTIDPVTGQLVWRRPLRVGLYNIAILIEEWRYIPSRKRHTLIGSIVRDMQIEIVETTNNPPSISTKSQICVLAGDTINELIFARDNDSGDRIRFSAAGGPLFANPPAKFEQNKVGTQYVESFFEWETNCSMVRQQPYEVVFKAVDDGNPDLVDLKPLLIKIVAPPPKNLTSSVRASGIFISWDKENCDGVQGYRIYRKLSSQNFIPSACITGLPDSLGYELIAINKGVNATEFLDNNNGAGLSPGNSYCYRVVSFYADGAESMASNETCNQLFADRPSIIKVSINSTNRILGSDSILWIHPSQFDTLNADPANPQYTYEVFRSSLIEPTPILVKTFNSPVFKGWKDTLLVENNLNTQEDQFTYEIKFYENRVGGRVNVGNSAKAQSVFLKGTPKDQAILLSWNAEVPWNIDSTHIYRLNEITSLFEKVGSTTQLNYLDKNLLNSITYTYYVKTFGSYSVDNFPKFLINNSQEIQQIPIDTVAPCAPILDTVNANCDEFTNKLLYRSEDLECNSDVVKYKIYRKSVDQLDFVVVKEVPLDSNLLVQEYLDNQDVLKKNLAGCYFVTAIDSNGNESLASNSICIDNCPQFILPNVFTPNGDGKNDFFSVMPDSGKFNKSIDLKIFNRWGDLVFLTRDPNFKWNGTHSLTGSELSAGVYFYVCEVEEQYLVGTRKRTIKGNITLLR